MEEKSFKNIFTVPNLITFTRILFTPFIFFALLKNDEYYSKIALILITAALLSDFFDGYLARKYKQISKWGKILDPIADKIMINGMAIILSLTRDFPIWLTLTILSRDFLIILLGSIMVFKKVDYVPQSNIFGKFALIFIVLSMLVYILDWEVIQSVKLPLILGAVALILISGVTYFIRFINLESKTSSRD
ncbi:MAG: CDP-alcohol phosphatidyltransferase family protein [bacterium]|nr:CDP-alcohol phosphatidyltransferase family protein [bacterium]